MRQRPNTTPGAPICDVASSNYVGSVGSGDPSSLYPWIIDDDDGPPGRDNGNGLFFRNHSVTIAQITDGTSQTFAAGERSQNLSRAIWTGAVTNAAVPLVALQAEAGLDPEGGGALVLSHTGEGHGPNSPSGLAHGDQYWSLHPGGANFLFADGSVRFIKEHDRIHDFPVSRDQGRWRGPIRRPVLRKGAAILEIESEGQRSSTSEFLKPRSSLRMRNRSRATPNDGFSPFASALLAALVRCWRACYSRRQRGDLGRLLLSEAFSMKQSTILLFAVSFLSLGLLMAWAQTRSDRARVEYAGPVLIERQSKHLVTSVMLTRTQKMTNLAAPAFRAPATDEMLYDLKELTTDVPAVLVFIKDGCPCSQAAQHYFNLLFDAFGTRARFLGIFDGNLSKAKKWASQNQAAFPLVSDPDLWIVHEFKAENSAYVALVAKGGKIEKLWPGYSVEMLVEAAVRLERLTGFSCETNRCPRCADRDDNGMSLLTSRFFDRPCGWTGLWSSGIAGPVNGSLIPP